MANNSRTSWNFLSRLLIIGLGVLFVGLILVLAFGSVTGRQLSPQTLAMRSYEYYRIPWTAIQITPVKYTREANVLVSHLADEGYLSTKGAAIEWDEVVLRGAGVPEHRGRAWVLAATLEMDDTDGVNYWLQWSENNPQLATPLWKSVGRAAVNRLYFAIPHLMAEARQVDDPVIATAAYDRILRTACRQQIATSQLEGELARVAALRKTLAALGEDTVERPDQ